MPNSSGFVDFNQTYDVTHDEEQRLMEAAMQRAEAADVGAQQQLVRTEHQAIDSGAEGLSKAASYSDYLKAKDAAVKAWAAVTTQSANPLSQAVRGVVGGKSGLDVAGRAAASRDDLAGREANMGKWTEEAYAGKQANDARQAADAQSKAAARDARAREDAANRAAYLNAVYGKYQAANLTGGRQEDKARYAQQMSTGIDEGWKLPDRVNGDPSMGPMGQDFRGRGIENDAWHNGTGWSGAAVAGPFKTKKGTAY